jgi:phosphoenolpyruvate synthase/pyruvate phosphate dikinase
MAWQKLLTREGVDITTISSIDLGCYTFMTPLVKNKKELLFTHFSEQKFTHYIFPHAYEIGQQLIQIYFKTPSHIQQHYKEGKLLLEYMHTTSQLWQQQLRESKTRDLLKAYQEFKCTFNKISLFYSMISWFAIEAWQTDFEQILAEMITRNNVKAKENVILATVYTPWKKTAIYEIQEKIESGISGAQLVEEYQFLRSWSAVWYKPLDISWISSFVPQKQTTEVLTKKQVLDILKPTLREKEFLDIAPYIIFFKDWRDDIRRTYCYLWTFLFEEIAKEWHTESKNIGYLSLDEIEEALANKKIPFDIITRRKNHQCIVTGCANELKIVVLDENIPEKYFKIIAETEKNRKTELIRGMVAFRGKITGNVKIIHSYHDVKHVEVGSILVANTTHPNYLPAMQRAGAFVTNEGGIISHAAIVAREMKKPCIVGTKNATRLLKDGDLVEVDAEKGIVRKIN